MTVDVSSEAVKLRELAWRVAGLELAVKALTTANLVVQSQSGDSSTTAFPVTKGQKPIAVFEAGDLQREGSDYTMAFDGFAWTVTFAVAPAAVDVMFINGRDL